MFVTELLGGDILRFTPSGTKTTFASGGSFSGLTFDSEDNLFAFMAEPTNRATINLPTPINGGIVFYSPDGIAHTFYGFVVGSLLAINPASGALFADSGDTIIVFSTPKIAVPAPIPGVFATGLVDGATSLAFDSAGNLFVSEGTNSIILKFPRTVLGARSHSGLEVPHIWPSSP